MNQTQPQNDVILTPLDLQVISARYKQIRQTGTRLNGLLVGRLSRETYYKGAEQLGIFHNGKIVLDDESQGCVLMDYCIFNVYCQGRNAVDQYLAEAKPASDSVEIDCWKAMRSATYSLLVVESIVPGVGCYVRDVANDSKRLLVDVGLSQSCKPGFVMSTRILDFGDFITTGGAALPIGNQSDSEERDLLMKLKRVISIENYDPAILISTALELGSTSFIRYDEVTKNARGVHRLEGRRTRELVNAPRKQLADKIASLSATNRRCRCGSGKMFKNCCGK